jgi:hypothetical protein
MDPPPRRGNLTLFGSAVLALGLLLIASQAFAGGASGTPLNLQITPTLDDAGKITICHAAGQAGTTQFVELHLPPQGVFGGQGQAGHFNENGTTLAGHEQDTFGECPEPTATSTATEIGGGVETPTATATDEATNTPTATVTEEATNTPTATGTTEATNTPTATNTTEAATSTPTSTATEIGGEVETPTPTATVEVDTPTPTATTEGGEGVNGGVAGITGVTEELAAGVAGGVQGGADLEQQVLGVQRAPAAAGVAGAQQVGALPRTGSGGDDGRSSGLLIAGIALAILGGALVSARVLARG